MSFFICFKFNKIISSKGLLFISTEKHHRTVIGSVVKIFVLIINNLNTNNYYLLIPQLATLLYIRLHCLSIFYFKSIFGILILIY